jgi:hypothetical protein
MATHQRHGRPPDSRPSGLLGLLRIMLQVAQTAILLIRTMRGY